MTITASDQPPIIGCGVANQAFLDLLNDERQNTFQCLLDLTIRLEALVAELPDTICNAFVPRFHTQTSSGQNNLSVTAPAGGTWMYIAVLDGAEAAVNQIAGGTLRPFTWAEGDTDDDRGFGGSHTGTVAGGTSITANVGNQSSTLSALFIRTDC